MEIVWDETNKLYKKKDWNVTNDFDKLGQDTVAQKIADTEGTSLEEARLKLSNARLET